MTWADFRYLRLRSFVWLMRPSSNRARTKRMAAFVALMGVRNGLTILDLGGTPHIWMNIRQRLAITILNLPGNVPRAHDVQHDLRYVEGDACRVEGSETYDIVFSNSVIEHVGAFEKRREFASEVRRLGRGYWVQTPAKWFPIEAHCGMPFWWFYPRAVQLWFIKRWRRKLPDWTRMVEGTTVLERSELTSLFPDGVIRTERSFGIPKAYIVYKNGHETS